MEKDCHKINGDKEYNFLYLNLRRFGKKHLTGEIPRK